MRERNAIGRLLGLGALAALLGCGAGSAFGQMPPRQQLAPPVDVAVGSGFLQEGQTIPKPYYRDGTAAVDSECYWILSQAAQELNLTDCSDGRLHCSPDETGWGVVANFATICGAHWAGWAGYLIIAIRPSTPVTPLHYTDVAVEMGAVADGQTIPLPKYADGTLARESDCNWIVNPADQDVDFINDQNPPLESWRGNLYCYTEGRTVVACFENESLGLTRPGTATYLIVATRPATEHLGMCSDVAISWGLLPEGGAIARPRFSDGAQATDANARVFLARSEQLVSRTYSDTLSYPSGRLECYPDGWTAVVNYEPRWGGFHLPGEAFYLAIATRPVFYYFHLAGVGAPVGQPLLKQNAPNPFNPRTTIRFDLPAAGPVSLSVYDLAGRLVKVLVEGEIPAGSHEAVWDGRDSAGRGMASGGYFARLQAGGKVETVRMGLVR